MRKTKRIILSVFLVVAIVAVASSLDVKEIEAADEYTSLLIHSDSSNTETTIFTDYSVDVTDATDTPAETPKVITANGDVVHDRDLTPAPTLTTPGGGTAQSAIEFDGTGDYLSIPDDADWAFGDEDFTIEAFVYTGAAGTIFSQLTGDAAGLAIKWEIDASDKLKLSLSSDGSTWDETVTSTTSVGSAAAWVHVAAVKYNDGTDVIVTQYIGGVADGTTLDLVDPGDYVVSDSAGAFEVGSASSETSEVEFNGHMQEPRISTGIARWTADFDTNLPTKFYGQDEFDQVTLSLDVQEVLTLDCGADVDLGTLNPGTPITASTTCGITTNSEGGFDLEVKRDDANTTLDHESDTLGTDTVQDIADDTDWDETAGTAWGSKQSLGFRVFKYTEDDGNTIIAGKKNDTWWGADTSCPDGGSDEFYAGLPPTYNSILNMDDYYDAQSQVHVCYKVDVAATQKSGSYDGTVTYQATTNP